VSDGATAQLQGRTVLVTGAALGIGRAICLRLASEGARIGCADIELEGAKATAAKIGANAVAIACDVTDEAQAAEAVARTLQAFGALHGLINNAAAPSVGGTVVDLAQADWQREIAVSLTGAFLMSKFAVPPIAASGGGGIVHVASQFARVAVAGSAAYCAAKAGLVNLAKVMALDHAAQAIRVNTLSPGAVATERLLRSHATLEQAEAALAPKHPIGRIAQPTEIAAAAAFLMSDDSSFMTGADLLVDGGYTAW
jgi:NAD(P)-dependent dehydrogenase (short-subunit alcohol dehydrogenase family)